MTTAPEPTPDMAPELLPADRDVVRREFMVRFGSPPSLRDGILVKRWATGPRKGEPKPTAGVQSMIDRGLLALLDNGKPWLRVHFTPRGIQALRLALADKRAFPAKDYQHLHDELAAWDDVAA